MVILYDLVFLIFAIAYLPYMFIKGKAHKDFLQRFGVLPDAFRKAGEKKPIWVHAVSVGEVLASRQFVDSLKQEAGRPVVVSTTTKTGNDLAKKIFGGDILKFYFPLDLSFIIKKVLDIIRPSVFVIFETEIWPNIVTEASRRNIPVMLLNGRISDSSYGGYKAIRFLFRGVLEKIEEFCMQTEADRARIIDIGAPADRVRVTGNMKFDVPRASEGLRDTALKKLGIEEDEKLLVAGSTHIGEDGIILDVYKELLKEFPRLRLLIAPRHVERSDEIAVLADEKGLDYRLLSEPAEPATEGLQPAAHSPVLILDTIGELKDMFSAATVVFMGGSLVKKGGHNIVEPALFSKPIIFGQHMSNFRDMARIFLENRASVQVKDKDSLKEAVSYLLQDEAEARSLGRKAAELVEKHRGATRRNLEEVLKKAGN